MINMLSRLSRKLLAYGEVAFCNVDRQVPPLPWAFDTHWRQSLIQQLSSFDNQYAMCAILAWSNEVPDQLNKHLTMHDVFSLILMMDQKSPQALYRALRDIYTALENGAIVTFDRALKTLFARYAPAGTTSSTGFLSTDLLDDPYDQPYVPGTSDDCHAGLRHTAFANRILRHFESDYAVRVSFRDDNLDKLTFAVFSMRTKDIFLEQIVGRHLQHGFIIGPRIFQFVAASSSQLRDHGVWFYAEDSYGQTADAIRRWMGDFHHISNVATRMARMGQCFSSTQETVEIRPDEEFLWDDVEHPESVHPLSGRPYCFSDGCGKISLELMQQVWRTLPRGASELQPSALQIRYRGCKGMVSLDLSLKGRALVLRKSMLKFRCDSPRKLEVIKWSAPMVMFLNRPLISILEHHNIGVEVFLRLQLSMILQLADSLVCEGAALRTLTSFVRTPVPFAGLAAAGWQLARDPFIIQVLYDLLKNALINLKDKANVAIPVNEGRNMLGIVDETGLLDYGQVFIQYTELPYNDAGQAPVRILEGDVVVTKCPCLHPGDVRRLRAVDIPALRHIRDCIVFPSRGKAPHPFEMSGSDLDGDEYICIWKPELILESNSDPYIYDDKPLGLNPYPNNLNETKFLCNYIGNDIIGIISNAHLAWADQAGLASDMCQALVSKASKALDFAKTGDAVELYPNEKPDKFPDFMEKGDHKHSYPSHKALGILYRTVRQIMAVNDTKLSKARSFSPLEVPGWEMFAQGALKALRSYNARLSHLMEQHGIQSEGEVFSGFIGTMSSFEAANAATFRTEKANLAVLVDRQKSALMEDTRQQFYRELELECMTYGAEDESARHMLRIQKAAAWYMVTYGDESEGHNGQNRGFFSFPWCIAHVLLEAKRWLIQFADRDRGYAPTAYAEPTVGSGGLRNALTRVIDESARTAASSCAPPSLQVPIGQLDEADRRRQLRYHVIHWLNDAAGQVDLLPEPLCDLCYAQVYEAFVNQCEAPLKLFTLGEYLVGLLGFLASGACTYPRRCERRGCRRLFDSDCPLLTVEAAKAYVRFAINKDACFLGFRCDQRVHRATDVIIDAPPEKLTISERFWRFLRQDRTAACKDYLYKYTGVYRITVRYERHKTRRFIPAPATATLLPSETEYALSFASQQGQVHLPHGSQPTVSNALPGTFTTGNAFSMKVHYCGTDTQIFAMQQCLRNDNFQASVLESNFSLLRQ
ncbi:RNA-dependent RNA polymerase 2-like [Tropilaelaps mercedesae]|uniref:RNA-dependent RNA polymerase n=1 Tax=Tropilaelaps mercedesae TaxID=418985 RepID=A0A1V9XXM0_9ACAR|nr:RNA-dependent RNA polymerase 2-like [Tropilaelaps mercedesae]